MPGSIIAGQHGNKNAWRSHTTGKKTMRRSRYKTPCGFMLTTCESWHGFFVGCWPGRTQEGSRFGMLHGRGRKTDREATIARQFYPLGTIKRLCFSLSKKGL